MVNQVKTVVDYTLFLRYINMRISDVITKTERNILQKLVWSYTKIIPRKIIHNTHCRVYYLMYFCTVHACSISFKVHNILSLYFRPIVQSLYCILLTVTFVPLDL
jgi:hypothetical protein